MLPTTVQTRTVIFSANKTHTQKWDIFRRQKKSKNGGRTPLGPEDQELRNIYPRVRFAPSLSLRRVLNKLCFLRVCFCQTLFSESLFLSLSSVRTNLLQCCDPVTWTLSESEVHFGGGPSEETNKLRSEFVCNEF